MLARRRWVRRVAVATATAGALVAGSVTALGAPPDSSGRATVAEDLRYYQAVVNLLPGEADEFAGGVAMQRVVGGETSVDVHLTRAFDVLCSDGTGSIASYSIDSAMEATEPGPVVLDIDRRLRAATGSAVVDLTVTVDPGCGDATEPRTAPYLVEIVVTGTTARFFTGISGTVSSGADRSTTRSFDLSRDGTGTVRIEGLIDETPSPAAFLKYAVDRTRTHGDPPAAPEPVAPPGGVGASATYAAEFQEAGAIGLLREDVIVTAGTSAAPRHVTTITASSLSAIGVECWDGPGVDVVVLEGVGPGTLDVGRRLSTATATGTLEFTRSWYRDCVDEPEPVVDIVVLPVTMDLTAVGPQVRVRDTRWQVRPGEGQTRTHGWYLGRDAAGTVSIGAIGGATQLAAIGSSGP